MDFVKFYIEDLNIVPKDRPRCLMNRRTPVHSKRYRDNQEKLVKIFKDFPRLDENSSYLVYMHFFGHAKGDLDNKAGSILDALKNAKKNKDDSVVYFPSLNISFSKSKNMLTILYFEKIAKAGGYIPQWVDDLIDSGYLRESIVDKVLAG